MANLVKPYGDDPFGPSFSTPITTSSATIAILSNLPAYRPGLSARARGLEIGMAHGYFLMGPFATLGPLRNSDVANFAGFLSVVGLSCILGVALALYGYVWSGKEKTNWNQFTVGFMIGAFGGAGVAFGLLNNINLS